MYINISNYLNESALGKGWANPEAGNQGHGAAFVTVLNQLCEPAGLVDWRDGFVANGLPTTSVLG